MLIGQDLLNSHFLKHPIQPTYHFNYILVITRTKMGLTFAGPFNDFFFNFWIRNMLKNESYKKVKKALYPDKVTPTSPNVQHELSPRTKQKLTDVLTLKLYKFKRDWKRYRCK